MGLQKCFAICTFLLETFGNNGSGNIGLQKCCTVCTFRNKAEFLCCEMCGKMKHTAADEDFARELQAQEQRLQEEEHQRRLQQERLSLELVRRLTAEEGQGTSADAGQDAASSSI